MNILNIVYFKTLSMSATVTTAGGMTPPNNTLVSDLPVLCPMFFTGYDNMGTQVLCAVKVIEGTLTITSGGNTFTAETATVSAPPVIESCILIGHPKHRPH